MHIDRILGSYTQRQRNEFKDFMKPGDAKFDTRTSLTKLWLVNGKLQPDQKKCVEEMGFSSITKIEFEQLDRELVPWLIDSYNPDESLITLDNPCHINISAAEAALGIPHRGDDIYLDFDSVEGINKYKNYFTVTSGRIDINELARKLESCATSGDEFKVCYLMFMFGTLLFPETLPNIRVGYLNIIVKLEKVSYMNWAKLVVEKLNNRVKLRKEHGRPYLTGCYFFAHIYPKGSTPGVNLTSPLPYVEQLTRERISNITLDFNNAGGYWNPKARVANESHNKFPVEIDATHNLVSPSTEKERCGVELDEHITHEKKNKKENFDGPEIDGNYFGDVTPPLQSWGIYDGYASTDDGSEEQEVEKCDERTNNKNTYFKFNGDFLHVPKVSPTLEARVSAMETIWCQVSQTLNTKFVGQSIPNVENSAMLTDNLLRQQIKLIEDLKDCITEMPKNMKSTIRTTVIDYGRYHLTREDVRTLGPECKIRGTIIDAVSYMCTLNERTRTFFTPNWFFPSIMTKHILDGKKDDDTLLDWYFKGNRNFTNSVEHLERVHFPIHDQKDHWFLAIVDFNLNVIDVCDTAPDRSNKEQRRNLIQRVVQRFDLLMHKYAGKNYKAKNVNTFLYEDMSWVPRQNNGYDCGLYVCLLMLFEKGVECIRTTNLTWPVGN
ncbi:hypothetical protein OROHE_000249 [Orobanche hederae]